MIISLKYYLPSITYIQNIKLEARRIQDLLIMYEYYVFEIIRFQRIRIHIYSSIARSLLSSLGSKQYCFLSVADLNL